MVWKKLIVNSNKNICKLKSNLIVTRRNLKLSFQNIKAKILSDFKKSLNNTGLAFVECLLENASKKRPNCTLQNKTFALTLYKRGPKSYKFLCSCVKLPAPSTLCKSLNSIPFNAGINQQLISKLKNRLNKMSTLDKFCCLVFDEMAISPELMYRSDLDIILGYVDQGLLCRCKKIADHALVFMVQGLKKKWKQPIAYYFTKDVVNTFDLKFLDEQVNDYAYFVNGKPIIHIFDIPHLLQNTRNCLYHHDIVVDDPGKKIIKFNYVQDSYNIDKNKRVSLLYSLKDSYFECKGQHKMKVSIAAKTLSNRVTSSIFAWCSSSNLLPAEAVHTAEFIDDIDKLFDSLNGRTLYPENSKTFRCVVSANSPHAW